MNLIKSSLVTYIVFPLYTSSTENRLTKYITFKFYVDINSYHDWTLYKCNKSLKCTFFFKENKNVLFALC